MLSRADGAACALRGETNHSAVYGAAAFCPICGPRPSVDTLRESIAAARRTLALEDEVPESTREAIRAEGVFDRMAADAVSRDARPSRRRRCHRG